MLIKILLLIALLLAGVLIVAAFQPSTFTITRDTQVAAPADVVYGQVADFHSWAAWSPWARLDPDMKVSYSGNGQGQGAGYAWEGNGKVGTGRMLIEEAQAPTHLRIRLEFLKPFASINYADFTFTPGAGQTKVAWMMEGERNYVMKVIGLFVNVDNMLGTQFEEGLRNLKQVSEKASRP